MFFGLERLPTYLNILWALWTQVRDVDMTSPRSVAMLMGAIVAGIIVMGTIGAVVEWVNVYSKKFVKGTYQIWLLLGIQAVLFAVFAPADIKARAWSGVSDVFRDDANATAA